MFSGCIPELTDPARALGVSVTFESGARTAWHTHPLVQTLVVTAGCSLGKTPLCGHGEIPAG